MRLQTGGMSVQRSPRHVRLGRSWALAALVPLAAACAASASPPVRAPVAQPGAPSRSPAPVATAHSAAHPVHSARRARYSSVGGWLPVTTDASGVLVDRRTVVGTDGVAVTIVRLHAGRTSFVLHSGSADPGPVPGSPYGGRVTGMERPRLVAAFNGGFKLSAGAGGYEQDRHVVASLRPGLASLVIDSTGQPHIGVWPAVTTSVRGIVSVVQNLGLLVSNGRLSPRIDERLAWGATLGHVMDVARSAVGVDASGDLLFAATMAASPRDIATALQRAGVVNAMELDINPQWVQLDAASRPGGPLYAVVPGQRRAADQYLLGWTRSFLAVLASR